MTPKVSICIPTYNQGQYLGEAIRSALAQTVERLEVVVSDNHSTDNTATVLQEFHDERLRVVRPDRHLCMAENFDFCIAASTGEYVNVLCSDDQLLPGYAVAVANALDRYPAAAMGYSAAFIVDVDRGTRRVEGHLSGDFFRKGSDDIRRFLRGSVCVFPAMMMRRTDFERAGGFYHADEAGREQASVIDWDIQLRLASLGGIVYVGEPLAEYRVWSNEQRHARLVRLIDDTARLYDTTASRIVGKDSVLRAELESARRARALTLACGLHQFRTRAEFEEGAGLILKVSDAAAVRGVIRLQSYGLSGLFSMAFHGWQAVRPGIKGLLSQLMTRRAVGGGGAAEIAVPPTSSIRRVTDGVLANVLGQLINTAGQLLLVPVFLAFWGQQLYGEWLVLSAAVTYLSMLDFGMQMYLVNRMNQCYVKGAYEEHTRILQSALLFSLLLCVCALVAVAPAAVVLPLERWFGLTHTPHRTVVLAEVFLCAQVVGAIPFGLVSGCYRAIQEYPRGQMVNNLRAVLSLAVTVLVVALGGGILAVASSQAAVLAGVAVWACWDLKRRHKEIALGLRHADLRLAISFLGPSSMFFLIQAAAATTLQGSVMMAGALFGAASVAVFVPLRTIANLIRQIAGALHSALWPEITALEASQRFEPLRSVHLVTSKVLVMASLCAAVFLHFTAVDIVALWTHHGRIFDAGLMNAFLVLLVAQSPWLTSSLVLAASNNHRTLSLCYIAAAVLGLGLGFVAAQRFGMPGIVYGICAGEALVCGWPVIRMACRLMKENAASFVGSVVLRAAPCAIALYVVLSWVFTVLPGGPLVRLFLFAAVTTLVGGMLGLFYFDVREKQTIRAGIGATVRRWQPLPSE